ncbi:uncharacterized protein ACLA_040560 [Aspergillus clavatus NRRL 1]|uniref:Uncharacterized protein n=1 Tax=Aspergillus clavatus (strain ATCC 1007 / CBS 513.65 / DSM 816 / NCTC 3887 / NRRL 1 / QM 1276 / 107) TaxID=344612 RepID=A1CL16_ASPCL|nr:uncharacterized protein ACLA_040560 [Aspergillus clavatus NRRL 1]EAW09840.1 conserved hypothetical protein [Aspergillus clavatus NRRL 1]
MCPMLLSGLADGPAMVLSPRQEHTFVQFPRQSQFDSPSAASRNSFFMNGMHSHASSFASNAFTGRLANSAPSSGKPSRKRSREEPEFEEVRNSFSSPVVPAAAPAPKKAPVYAEGMTTLNSCTGIPLSVENQTGFQSRKAQRLTPSTSRVEDTTLQRLNETNDDNSRLLSNGTRTSPFTPNDVLVDDATHLLGVSWQRISTNDVDIAAAVRGWKRYIDKQFAAYLFDSQILMKNRALNAYLVTARPLTPAGPSNAPAFYLFSEDLTQGQLVASSWEQCVHNLRSTPVVFEQNQVLNAADRPLNNTNNTSVLGSTSMTEPGLPLLQTMCAQPVSSDACAGLNNGVGMAMGMEIDP